MDLRQLRYFTAIAEAGSLSRASDRLHIAQPALSLHLAKLEEELGVALMLRNNRGVSLTPQGESLLRHAVRILKDCDATVSSFRSASTSPSGEVAVGFPLSTPDILGQLFLERLNRECPRISLRLLESSSERLEETLQGGELDFAVIMFRRSTSGFDIHPLLFEELVLVSPHETSDGGREIEFREVCELPLFLPRVGNSLRDMVDEAAVSIGKPPNVVHEISAPRFMKSAVRSGYGHAILPWGTVGGDRAQGKFLLRRIVNPNLRALVGLAESVVRPSNHARYAVKQMLVDIISSLVQDGIWPAKPYSQPKTGRARES